MSLHEDLALLFDTTTLDKLAETIHKDNVEKGFWDDHVIGGENDPVVKAQTAQRLMLIVSELAEALEADRKSLMDDKLPQYKGLEVELADALIRILDMCGGYGIPIGEIVNAKLQYNRTREYKHGKQY